MSDFIKFTAAEEKKWKHLEALQSGKMHTHLQALLNRETARHFNKRLKHIETREEFELIEEEIQDTLRFPFMSESARHFETYYSKAVKIEKLNDEISTMKKELKL